MTAAMKSGTPSLDVERIRAQFPALRQRVHGKRLAYLDTAASALRPQPVIDAVVGSYSNEGANVHRGVHLLSQRATLAYDEARKQVASFVNAEAVEELIFVRGTTEGINLVAEAWGGANVGEGDEVVVTHLEHHSNFVPWQRLCERVGATFKVIPVTDEGVVELDAVKDALSPKTKVVACAHVSNTLGTILPVREIAELAHEVGAIVVVDGAQGAPHLPVDVRALGVDFYTFSGHKLYGPNGIGALWGRRSLLEAMPPYQSGGGMIRQVGVEKTTYAPPPERFEAGTPNVAGAIGLGAAAEFVTSTGLEALDAHERELLSRATEQLLEIDGLRLIGTAPDKIGVLSFVLEGVHPHDLGTLVDAEGVAIRAGHHCTQPLMKRYGLAATARATFGMYNTQEDVDQLVAALRKAKELFS